MATRLQLAPLPQGVGANPTNLVLAINDRLRRISIGGGVESGPGPGGGGVPAPVPPAAGGAAAGYVNLTVDVNRYTIDLALGNCFRLLLTAAASKSVPNAGFEAGDLTGWTSTNPPDTSVIAGVSHLGMACMQSIPNGALESTYCDLTGLDTTQSVIVSVWIRGDAGGTAQGFLRLVDTVAAVNTDTPPVTPDTTWQRLSVGATVPAGGNLRVALCNVGTGMGNLYFDDVFMSYVTVDAPIRKGGTVNASDKFWLYIDQDGTGGWPGTDFEMGSDGSFAADATLQSLDGTPNTRSAYAFTYHGTRWAIDSFRTGGAIE
jgi:hypothetical protein